MVIRLNLNHHRCCWLTLFTADILTCLVAGKAQTDVINHGFVSIKVPGFPQLWHSLNNNKSPTCGPEHNELLHLCFFSLLWRRSFVFRSRTIRGMEASKGVSFDCHFSKCQPTSLGSWLVVGCALFTAGEILMSSKLLWRGLLRRENFNGWKKQLLKAEQGHHVLADKNLHAHVDNKSNEELNMNVLPQNFKLPYF